MWSDLSDLVQRSVEGSCKQFFKTLDYVIQYKIVYFSTSTLLFKVIIRLHVSTID